MGQPIQLFWRKIQNFGHRTKIRDPWGRKLEILLISAWWLAKRCWQLPFCVFTRISGSLQARLAPGTITLCFHWHSFLSRNQIKATCPNFGSPLETESAPDSVIDRLILLTKWPQSTMWKWPFSAGWKKWWRCVVGEEKIRLVTMSVRLCSYHRKKFGLMFRLRTQAQGVSCFGRVITWSLSAKFTHKQTQLRLFGFENNVSVHRTEEMACDCCQKTENILLNWRKLNLLTFGSKSGKPVLWFRRQWMSFETDEQERDSCRSWRNLSGKMWQKRNPNSNHANRWTEHRLIEQNDVVRSPQNSFDNDKKNQKTKRNWHRKNALISTFWLKHTGSKLKTRFWVD